MSDRARGSVRTDSREGAGTGGGAGEVIPGGDTRAAGGSTAAGNAAASSSGGPGGAPAEPGPAEQTTAVRPESSRSAAAAPVVDGTQVITPHSPPSGVFAGPTVRGAPVRPGPAVAPGGRAPGSSAGARGAGQTAAPRGAFPATTAPPRMDSTQAVPRPGAGDGPASATARPAESPGGPPVAGTEPQRAGRSQGRSAAGRGPRRARLQLRHIDTWSALKISLVVSIALFFVWMVAIGVLYGVLNGLGVFTTLNDLFGQLGSVSRGSGGNSKIITPGVVLGGAAVIGLINVVLMTALCTVGTVIYNLCSDLVGGLEVTLSERD